MLFNSFGFIFLYLPFVLFGFFQLGKINHSWAAGWLAVSSLFFYGYWNPIYVGLLLSSIVFNYAFGVMISGTDSHKLTHKKYILILAITANLLLLVYYKYANFFVSTINSTVGTHLSFNAIILPLGISFFTFTQIAFLVDTYLGKVKEYNFIHYLLFVTYFPHLIAGPVLHHKEMMPQFSKPATFSFEYGNLIIGLIIFFIGLFKKVVLADGISVYVDPIFSAPNAGVSLTFIEAWGGAICYAMQLYFDFSGYSDMAIGLSRMFGVTLPLNFHSPYKSVNIIEFWRRWHMTLSRFLREYLYVPLGGNRKGKLRRYQNLMLTMLLGGLWHGADWTFIIWGGLHGLYLSINHGWQALRKKYLQDPQLPISKPAHVLSVVVTFLAVITAWVIFRSDSIYNAIAILKPMFGFDGAFFGSTNNLITKGAINWIWISLLIVWFAPNTQQIMAAYKPALDVPDGSNVKWLLWQPSNVWLVVSVLCSVYAIISISELSEFIYFRF
jgi:D-alanyl-lipoteichoic acid acyltransferase DltB (MBOAT superfamily)